MSLSCLMSSVAVAYDDAECSRQETVSVTVEEEFVVWNEMDVARRRALDRTNQLAISQVIGVEVKSLRENRSEIINNDAEQRFKQFEQTNLAGWVRVKILEENRRTNESGGSLSLKTEVTVCVPKSEAVRKAEQERADRQKRPPRPVDPTTVAWFDPVTGQPRVWYSREA